MAATNPQSQLSHRIAPTLGTDAEFAAVRAVLEECGYTPERICERLGITQLDTYEPGRFAAAGLQTAEQAVDVLILLLMDGEFVAAETVQRLLPAGAAEKLQALNLIARDLESPEQWFGGCILFPTRGMWLASDRVAVPGSDPMAAGDLVFPAAIENTVKFMATLPETPCCALLDLGTGSGVAALDGARYADHSWGTDIAERSVHFAEFNRRLNAIRNATMLAGDLYAPVEGLTFDRIVTHPPYVPARKNAMIFRDGGEDGEQILRGIVRGLPRFLRPGGRFYSFVVAADCEDQWFEDRLRLWLGDAQSEFDLVLAAYTLTDPRDLTANSFLGQNTALEDIRYRHQIWTERKVNLLFNGSVLMRRHSGARPAVTARVLAGDGFTAEHVEWLLNWSTDIHDAARLEELMGIRPLLSPHAELAVTHRMRDGHLTPELFSLRTERPFESDCMVQQWLTHIVAQCDGKTTWREHFERAKSEGVVHRLTSESEFLGALEPLVTNGLVWIVERPLPGLAS